MCVSGSVYAPAVCLLVYITYLGPFLAYLLIFWGPKAFPNALGHIFYVRESILIYGVG